MTYRTFWMAFGVCAAIAVSSSADARTKGVKVKPSKFPTATLTASASGVASGSSVTLSWSSTNVKSCSATGGWSGARPASGSALIPDVRATETFTLTCAGKKGTASQTVSVEILPTPSVSVAASSTSVPLGSPAMLSWAATDATTCEASGAWTGSRPPSGTELTERVAHERTYKLICSGKGGTASAQVIVGPICSDGLAPRDGPTIRGIKFWMSNNPPDLFDEYLGKPLDREHYESWHDVLLEARCAGVNNVNFQLSTGVMTDARTTLIQRHRSIRPKLPWRALQTTLNHWAYQLL